MLGSILACYPGTGPHTLAVVLVLWFGAVGSGLFAQSSPEAPIAGDVRRAWDSADAWLKTSPSYTEWLRRLRRDELLSQLNAAPDSDVSTLQSLAEIYSENSALLPANDFQQFRSLFQQFTEASKARWNDLIGLARAALAAPRKVDYLELESERSQVLQAIADLENRLAIEADNRLWLQYFQLGAIRRLLSPGAPLDLAELVRTGERLRSAEVIWPAGELQRLEKSYQQFARDVRIFGDPDYAEARRQRIEKLVELLTQHGQSTNDQFRTQIAPLVGWLKLRGDAPALVDALQARFLRANLLMQISAAALADELNRNLQEDFPVNEVFVGTPMSGNGTLTGRVTSQTRETERGAAIELDLDAETKATTSGSKNGVRISSTGRTRITGSKLILIEPSGLQALPTEAQASALVNFNSINAPGRRRYREEATSRVYQSRSQAEAETEASALRLAKGRLDDLSQQEVARINDTLRRQIIYPLVTRGVWPRSVSSSANSQGLSIGVLQADWDQWGADSPAPTLNPSADASLQMHATLIERTADAMLRGRRYSGQELLDALRQFPISAGSVEAGAASNDADQNAWSLTFSDERPVAVRFEDDQVRLTLRLREFTSEGTNYPGMEVHLVYGVRTGDGMLHFAQSQPLRSLPLGFVSGAGNRLTGPQQVMRNVLNRRLARMAVPEYLVRTLFPEGVFTRLTITQAEARQGWLLVTMSRQNVSLPN
jgi:hypothetical protein